MIQYLKRIFITTNLLLLFTIVNIAYAKVAIIDVEILNARTGPGTDYRTIDKLTKGNTYEILEEKNQWYKIKINSNTNGWIASWFVSTKENSINSTSQPNQPNTTEQNDITNQTNITNQLNMIDVVKSSINGLNVRTGPSTNFPVIQSITSDQYYELIENNGVWSKIKINNSSSGWVINELIQFAKKDMPKTIETNTATVSVDVLNVRSKPNTSAKIIDKLTKGQSIEIQSIKDGWYQIKYKNEIGWVASEFTNRLNTDNGTNKTDEINSIDDENDDLPVDSAGDLANASDNKADSSEPTISQTPQVIIPQTGLNIRSGPGTNYNIVTSTTVGEKFPIINTHDDWYEILLPSNVKAFIAGWIVQVEGLENTVKAQSYEGLLKGKTIVIDAGHGGIDSGAIGSFFKTYEKNITLSTALLLEKKLKATGANVIMTRNNDTFLSLTQRVDISVKNKADAFISVHYNTNHNQLINGTIVYYYTQNGNDTALAKKVQQEIISNTGLKDLGARQGNYFVLRENPQLAILVEAAFLSNYDNELLSKSKQFHDKVAEGIFQGILKYFK